MTGFHGNAYRYKDKANGLMRRIMLLLREVNVKRQDTDKEARR